MEKQRIKQRLTWMKTNTEPRNLEKDKQRTEPSGLEKDKQRTDPINLGEGKQRGKTK